MMVKAPGRMDVSSRSLSRMSPAPRPPPSLPPPLLPPSLPPSLLPSLPLRSHALSNVHARPLLLQPSSPHCLEADLKPFPPHSNPFPPQPFCPRRAFRTTHVQVTWPLLPPSRYDEAKILRNIACLAPLAQNSTGEQPRMQAVGEDEGEGHARGEGEGKGDASGKGLAPMLGQESLLLRHVGAQKSRASSGASHTRLGMSRPDGDAQIRQVTQDQTQGSTSERNSQRRARIKCNPFDVLREAPDETQVVARWRLGESTRGTFRDLCLQDPYDAIGRGLTALVEVHGRPWVLQDMRLESNGGAVLRLLAHGRARCEASLLQGLDSRDLRAQMCVSVEERAEFESAQCVLQDAFALVRVSHEGRAQCEESVLQYGDTGLALLQQGCAEVSRCCMRRLRLGALCAFGNTLPASRLSVRGCYGADAQMWVTERRPGTWSSDEMTSFDPLYWSEFDRRAESAACMRNPIVQRCVYRERKYVCKERMKPHEHASALVREDNRRLLSETLNRQHAWLYRRRYARHYLVYMGLERESEGGGGEKRAHNDIDEKLIGLARGSLAGSSEVRVKEIDSEEDLYAEEFAFTKSASGPPVPLTLAMAEAKGHRPDLVTKNRNPKP